MPQSCRAYITDQFDRRITNPDEDSHDVLGKGNGGRVADRLDAKDQTIGLREFGGGAGESTKVSGQRLGLGEVVELAGAQSRVGRAGSYHGISQR